MRIRSISVIVFLLLVALTTPATAVTVFTANLTGDQEVPPATPTLTSTGEPRPASFGTATFTLNDAMTSLVFTATIFNIDVTPVFGLPPQTADINDDLTRAHIHAPAAPGSNAGIVWGFVGTPDNDINPKDLVVVPFPSGVGGTFTSTWDAAEGNNTTLAEQLSNILGGLAYINFHTTQFGGGEIRGQILQVAAVSEPAAFILSGVGLLIVGFAVSRWKKRTP